MTTRPLFSVITVTKDNFQGLKNTHTSLACQSFRDFEWIVINGGSDEATAAYLNTTAAFHISEPDRGIYDAMNKGIKRAKGRYLLFLNAGDRLAGMQVLERVHQSIHSNHPDFIYGDSLESIADAQNYKRAKSYTTINQGMFTHHQAMFYKGGILKEQIYDSRYIISADYEFTLRFLDKAQNIYYMGEPLCIFESGGISQMRAFKGRAEQFIIRQKRHYNMALNMLIFMRQALGWSARCALPGFYWKLKAR